MLLHDEFEVSMLFADKIYAATMFCWCIENLDRIFKNRNTSILTAKSFHRWFSRVMQTKRCISSISLSHIRDFCAPCCVFTGRLHAGPRNAFGPAGSSARRSKTFAAEDVLEAIAKVVRVTGLDSCPHGTYFTQWIYDTTWITFLSH